MFPQDVAEQADLAAVFFSNRIFIYSMWSGGQGIKVAEKKSSLMNSFSPTVNSSNAFYLKLLYHNTNETMQRNTVTKNRNVKLGQWYYCLADIDKKWFTCFRFFDTLPY